MKQEKAAVRLGALLGCVLSLSHLLVAYLDYRQKKVSIMTFIHLLNVCFSIRFALQELEA